MDLRGKRVTIIGMGRTALALSRLLLREGAEPFVSEEKDGPVLQSLSARLDALGVPHERGGHSMHAFEHATLVIPSPGVAPNAAPLERARKDGIMLLGEMEFAWQFASSTVLAVTGTNGKTTTTELLRALVAACGHRVLLAGNNEMPLSEAVMAEPAPEFVVLEASSFQLAYATSFRPWLAALLNVTPDHLGWHGGMEAYIAAKQAIFARQGPGDVAVLNADDPVASAIEVPDETAVWRFSLTAAQDRGLWVRGRDICEGSRAVAQLSDTQLPGRHNVQNVLAALCMMRAGGFAWDRVLEGLRQFKGVEHRLELVAEWDGVTYYNDSKSTNIDSLRVALESFEQPVVLIAGGQGKGGDYRVLMPLVARRVRALVAFGEDAPLLEAAFGEVAPVRRAADMSAAVMSARELAVPGDAVLLSPACASFDMFDNFEHRGRAFKACVLELEKG